MIEIRTITKDDADAFWKLRLLGLRLNPEAFYSSYEESVADTMENVVSRIHPNDNQYIVGAFTQEGELAGIAGFMREQKLKLIHKADIWGVFVSPDHRRKGIGRKLLEEIIDRAQKLEGLVKINLSTMAANEPARRLYRSVGFEPYGVERKALQVNGRFLDEELMAYDIDEQRRREPR